MTKRPNEMTKEELLELVDTMSSWALDLAQHLDFTTNMLKVQYKKSAYQRAIQMAWQICYAWDHEPEPEGNFSIHVFGQDGLVNIKGGPEIMFVENDNPLPVKNVDGEEIDWSNFEQVFDALDGWTYTDEDVLKNEGKLKFWRQMIADKTGKEEVFVKVKTLRRLLPTVEFMTDMGKASRTMLNMMRGYFKDLPS